MKYLVVLVGPVFVPRFLVEHTSGVICDLRTAFDLSQARLGYSSSWRVPGNSQRHRIAWLHGMGFWFLVFGEQPLLQAEYGTKPHQDGG